MIKKQYRLKDYIITEYDQFLYSWEMNIVLGEHRIGNCFIIGDILVIDSFGQEKDGCLKLEYHELLRKLPVWNKTSYYCFSNSLKDVNTGQNLSFFFNRWKDNQEKIPKGIVRFEKIDTYRLVRYKILVQGDKNISWQIYDRLNQIKGGPCILESGILFIGSKEYEAYEKQSKKEWFRRLKLLPKCNIVFAWGHLKTLRKCHREKETKKSESFVMNLAQKKFFLTGHILSSQNHEHNKGNKSKTLQSSLEKLKPLLNCFDRVKDWWGRFHPLIVEALWTFFRLFLLFFKKIILSLRKTREYFQTHHKK